MTYDPNREPGRREDLNVNVENRTSSNPLIGLILLVIIVFLIWYFFGGQIAEWFNSMNTPAPQ